MFHRPCPAYDEASISRGNFGRGAYDDIRPTVAVEIRNRHWPIGEPDERKSTPRLKAAETVAEEDLNAATHAEPGGPLSNHIQFAVSINIRKNE